MISISGNQSAQQAESYYEQENYYQKNSTVGNFYGKGLEGLGIEAGSPVDKKSYQLLLQGYHPSQKKSLTKNSGSIDRRAGFDVTFSAPKSLSILMEAYEANDKANLGKELRDAHERSVQKAMKKIQDDYTMTRIVHRGITRRVQTDGLMYASFQHDITRANTTGEIDPQLHTHNFIFNVVSYSDNKTNKYLTLSNEDIFNQKMYLGQYYRSELAKEMIGLGYQIDVTDRRHGFFEVAGIDRNMIDEFSGRSIFLRKHLEEYRSRYLGRSDSELLNYINANTKKAKQKIDRRDLLVENKNRLDQVGIDKEFLSDIIEQKYNNVKDPKDISSDEKSSLIRDHLQKTADFLTEYQSVFSREDLLKNALKYGLDNSFVEADYLREFSKFENIIKLAERKYSTKEMIDTERYIVRSVIRSNGSMKPLSADSEKMKRFVDEKYSSFTGGQRNMFHGVIGSKNQFIAIQGDAGSGKTYAAKAIREAANIIDPGQEVIGISFTGKAAEGLESDSGIKSRTIHSFLYNEKKNEALISDEKKRLIIVDESGMVGSRQMAEIIQIAEKNKDRVVFIGDDKQFSSIAAGNAFVDIKKYGAQTIHMDEVMRQKTDDAKILVSALKQRDTAAAINILKESKSIKEDTSENIYNRITNEYLATVPKEKYPLIITGLNRDRKNINDTIRSRLELKGDEKTILETADLHGMQAHYTDQYNSGMILAVGKVPSFRLGEQLEVIGSKDNRKLIVKRREGTTAEIDVYEHGGNITAYQKAQRDFAPGDKIVYTKNVRSDGFMCKNGESDTISQINKNGEILTEKGKTFTVDSMPFLDHGYAITDYKAQGVTADKVIVYASAQTASYSAFYVQATRAKYSTKVYTDSLDAFSAKIQKTAENESTLNYTKEIIDGRENIGETGRDREGTAGHSKPVYRVGETKRGGAGRFAAAASGFARRSVAGPIMKRAKLLIDATIQKFEKYHKRTISAQEIKARILAMQISEEHAKKEIKKRLER